MLLYCLCGDVSDRTFRPTSGAPYLSTKRGSVEGLANQEVRKHLGKGNSPRAHRRGKKRAELGEHDLRCERIRVDSVGGPFGGEERRLLARQVTRPRAPEVQCHT